MSLSWTCPRAAAQKLLAGHGRLVASSEGRGRVVLAPTAKVISRASDRTSAAQPLKLNLYGEVYDVSSIGSWHPGGAVIIRQASSLRLADASSLFESQHSMRDPDEMRRKLSPYRVNATRAPEQKPHQKPLQLYTFREDGFYRVVRKRVAAFLRDPNTPSSTKGEAPKGGGAIVIKWASFSLCSLGLLTASVQASSLSASGLWAFGAGGMAVAASFALLHDASHFAAFKRSVEVGSASYLPHLSTQLYASHTKPNQNQTNPTTPHHSKAHHAPSRPFAPQSHSTPPRPIHCTLASLSTATPPPR